MSRTPELLVILTQWPDTQISILKKVSAKVRERSARLQSCKSRLHNIDLMSRSEWLRSRKTNYNERDSCLYRNTSRLILISITQNSAGTFQNSQPNKKV